MTYNSLQFQNCALDIYKDAAELTYEAVEIDKCLRKDKGTIDLDKQKLIYRVSCIEQHLKRLKEQVLSL